MDRKGYCSRRFSVFAICPRKIKRESDRNFTCLSPWSILSCWFSLRRTKSEVNILESHSEEDDAKYGEIMECMHGGSSSPAADGTGHGKEVSFNIGVGFGIIYLMAATKCKLNKMVELCKQMETLVQDFKMQLQNQQTATKCGPSELNMAISTSTKAQDQTHQYSLEAENSDAASIFDLNSYSNTNTILKNTTKMDQLEAELEVELEHLQIQLDTEVMMDSQCSETVIEDSAPEESISTLSYGQVYEPTVTMINMENNGVCPFELERRLHELLEKRQEERMKALESALECAMQKLHENERELSWWKETARLVFQKMPHHYPSLGEHTFKS